MRTKSEEETDLLEKLKAKDEIAFAKLYAFHVDRTYAYALMILKSPDLAADVVQETFVKLWENPHLIDSTRPLQAYLLAMIRNKSLNVIRRAAKEESITEEIASHVFDHSETGLQYTERRQSEQLIYEAVQDLPVKRKEIYELCHQEGYSYKQAAEKLGLSYSTVNSQMVKAIKTIKSFLIKNGALFFMW